MGLASRAYRLWLLAASFQQNVTAQPGEMFLLRGIVASTLARRYILETACDSTETEG